MSINATLIAQMIVFLILIWFTMKFIWPPLVNAMNERSRRIEDGLAAAERARAELKEADAQVADEIRKARQQAAEIIDKAQQQSSQILEKARADAIADIDRQKAAGQAEIERMAERARRDLREHVSQLAVQGAEKIIQREIDPAAHKAMLEQLAAEI